MSGSRAASASNYHFEMIGFCAFSKGHEPVRRAVGRHDARVVRHAERVERLGRERHARARRVVVQAGLHAHRVDHGSDVHGQLVVRRQHIRGCCDHEAVSVQALGQRSLTHGQGHEQD